MIHSTRFKLIICFLMVSFLVGGVSLFIGGHLLYNAVLHEAKNQVRLGLSAAHDVYNTQIKYIKVALNITTLGSGFRTSLMEHNIPDLTNRMKSLAKHANLDFVGITSSRGNTFCRIGINAAPQADNSKTQLENTIARYAISYKQEAAGTVVLSKTFIAAENPQLAERIQFYPLQAENSDRSTGSQTMVCLAIAAAIPIFADNASGDLMGVLYGGIVLNQSTDIVDSVRKSFFFDEIQQEANKPAATIFFDTIPIATNLIDKNGLRAIGTPVSDEIKENVLFRGKIWTTRQNYSDNRYLAAYEPIEDIVGRRVGMLSIAVLESNYSKVQKNFFLFFVAAISIGAFIAIGMGYVLAYQIMKPMHRLMKASREVSEGSLSPNIGPISNDKEIAVLQKTFKDMVESMKRRRMESKTKIIQSEKQASVGRLAAGVAHEINNPLTGVLTYTHMLLRRKDIPDDIRSDLKVVAESTERVRKIVKGLLDFSRQTKLDPEPTEINRLVDSTVKMVENQALIKGVNITFHPGENLPMLVIDRSQIQSVLLNIILNAFDATKPSDHITISTSEALSASDKNHRGVEITIADTGCGIPAENLDKLFDPFFSTKEVGQGTGLGLSVSFGIVKEHNGNIRLQSEVGKGTTFFVWLPVEKQDEKNENLNR
ncbi:MAG: ATP-binding protein [Desulfobacterales bacterium]